MVNYTRKMSRVTKGYPMYLQIIAMVNSSTEAKSQNKKLVSTMALFSYNEIICFLLAEKASLKFKSAQIFLLFL